MKSTWIMDKLLACDEFLQALFMVREMNRVGHNPQFFLGFYTVDKS